MVEANDLQYGEYREESLHISPDPEYPNLLHLIRRFSYGVGDEKLWAVVSTICKTCPVVSTCLPQFRKSSFLADPKIDGCLTQTDACALGRDDGAFIPARFFNK